jgi:cell division protein DivIC
MQLPKLPDTPIWRLLRNRYLLVSLSFVLYMIFFDNNNLFNQEELKGRKAELERDKAFFLEEILETKRQLIELETSPENLEKYAREAYFLRKPGEDVYVFIEHPEAHN